MSSRITIIILLALAWAGFAGAWYFLSPEGVAVRLSVVGLLVLVGLAALSFELAAPGTFGLVLKQMRQRALSSWLTLLSVVLGVALATAVMVLQRQGPALFAQSDFGYDVLVGAKGSKLQLVLNTVYHLAASPGNIPYELYERMETGPRTPVKWAVPFAVGDTYNGMRIVASTAELFPSDHDGKPLPDGASFEYRLGRTFELAEGRAYHPQKFEAVIGSEVPRRAGLAMGSTFKATHGQDSGDVHDETWTVVGVLDRTGTANDRVIFIPLTSFYAIPEHESALEQIFRLEQINQAARKGAKPPEAKAPETKPAAKDDDPDEGESLLVDIKGEDEGDDAHAGHHHDAFAMNPDGTIDLKLPKEQWKLSAIAVRSRGGFPGMQTRWGLHNLPDAMAVNPASEMRQFFDTFLKPSTWVLLAVSVLVTVVAAVSILVSIYNAVSARQKEIAVLRALGATRVRVLTLICLEAGLIGLVGAVLGTILGHLVCAAGSVYMERAVGRGFNWFSVGWPEGIYLVGVVAIAVVAGLVPALKAYRTPVATNLVAA